MILKLFMALEIARATTTLLVEVVFILVIHEIRRMMKVVGRKEKGYEASEHF